MTNPSRSIGSTGATVYSPCARLTIQKLLLERGSPELGLLEWFPEVGWVGTDLINDPIFNMAVHQASDGPGYYNAEINVKGRIIFGYTWNVRNLNEGAGDYRITFSFDEICGTATINTFFIEGVTQIMVPIEETADSSPEDEGDTGGATAVLVPAEFDDQDLLVGGNLTYMDVRILERSGG